MPDPRAWEQDRHHEKADSEQHEWRLGVNEPEWIAAKIGQTKCPRVVVTDLPVAARQGRSIHAPVHQQDAAQTRGNAGGKTEQRSPVRERQPGDEHAGKRRQVRPDHDRGADGKAGQPWPVRHDEKQRERPRCCDRHVAHGVHDLIEKHGTDGDKRRRDESGLRRVEQSSPEQIRQPDRQRAADRHDQKRAAITGDGLKQCHQQRESGRVDGRNRAGIARDRPKTQRGPCLRRAWPRRVAQRRPDESAASLCARGPPASRSCTDRRRRQPSTRR